MTRPRSVILIVTHHPHKYLWYHIWPSIMLDYRSVKLIAMLNVRGYIGQTEEWIRPTGLDISDNINDVLFWLESKVTRNQRTTMVLGLESTDWPDSQLNWGPDWLKLINNAASWPGGLWRMELDILLQISSIQAPQPQFQIWSFRMSNINRSSGYYCFQLKWNEMK